MRETLSGVRVIRAFVRTRHEEARFESASRDLYEVQLQAGRIFAITQPVIFAIFNLSTVAVLWFGASQIEAGNLSIGNLTAFLQYLLQILFATLTAVFLFILVPRAAVSSGRIRDVLDTEPSIHDPDLAVVPAPDGPDRGVVEFRNVEFRYPGAEQAVLRGITFRAAPGRTTAIVGSTGAGKSTLVNLIPRFYDATSGTVLVDGVDVRAMNRDGSNVHNVVVGADCFDDAPALNPEDGSIAFHNGRGRCEIAAGEQPSFRLPTLVEDAEYAVEAAVLGEADVVRLQRRLDELERRLQTVEERLPRRAYRKLTRTTRRVFRSDSPS